NRDGMPQGILGQCLHREGRYVEVETLRVNSLIYLQPVLITKLLEGQVLTREFVLLAEFDQFAAIFLERIAQHVAEALDRAFRHRRAELYKRVQSVERVKQEMRIQSRAHGIQTGFCRERLCAR